MLFSYLSTCKTLVYRSKHSLLKLFAVLISFAGFSWSAFSQTTAITPQISVLFDSAKINLRQNPVLCISFANEFLKAVRHDDSLKTEALFLKAEAFIYLSMIDSALAIYLNLESSFSNRQNHRSYINIINKTGRVYAQAGDFPNAEIRFTKSLNFAVLNNDSALMAKALNNLGNIKTQTGETGKALECFLKSYRIKVKLNDTETIGSTLINLGNVYGTLGKNELAMTYFEKALNYIHAETDPFNYTSIQINIGANLLEMKRLKDAAKKFDVALILSRKNGFQNLIPGIYQNFAELFRLKGDFENALHYTQLYSKANDSLGNQVAVQKIRTLESRLESEKKDKEISQLFAEKAMKDLELSKQKNKVIFVVLCSFILMLLIFLTSQKIRDENQMPALKSGKFINRMRPERYFTWLIIAVVSAYFSLYFFSFGNFSVTMATTTSLTFSVFVFSVVFICLLGTLLFFERIKGFGQNLSWSFAAVFVIVDAMIIMALIWLSSIYVFRFEINFGHLSSEMFIASIVPVSGLFTMFYSTDIQKNKLLITELNRQLDALKIEMRSEIQAEQMITITGRNLNEVLELPLNCFVFAKAEDNYVTINYLNMKVLTKVFFRIPLSELEHQLNSFGNIRRCHRSYLINTMLIKEIRGNSKKSFAHLNITDAPEVPFSIKFQMKNEGLA